MVDLLNKQLIDKGKLKDEFLDDVAHGILTPANGMVGIAEALYEGKDGGLNEIQRSNLELIISNGRRLSNLVNDIQDFSRLKNRDIAIKIDNIDLNYVSESVIAICKALVQGENAQIINEIPPDAFFVKADENKLYQIFYNLLENAIKFTPTGKISISALRNEQSIEVAVEDTGIGIPKEKSHTIFEPYVQIAKGDNIKYGSFGLGLCIDQTEKAYELLGEFSNYLRGKFGLRSMDRPIPLGREIDLIRSYMSIEKARFGNKLTYEMEIETGENQLIVSLGFFRSHKSYLVNINRIEVIKPMFKSTFSIKLQNCKTDIPVSRRYAVELKEMLHL